MGMFDFGMEPTSDQCEELVIECMYDEIPAESAPLPRWFEIAAGEALFNIGNEPVDYEDMITKEFKEAEITAVGPEENGGDEEGVVPIDVAIGLSYYQKDIDHKEIIVIEMDFAELVEVTEE